MCVYLFKIIVPLPKEKEIKKSSFPYLRTHFLQGSFFTYRKQSFAKYIVLISL